MNCIVMGVFLRAHRAMVEGAPRRWGGREREIKSSKRKGTEKTQKGKQKWERGEKKGRERKGKGVERKGGRHHQFDL